MDNFEIMTPEQEQLIYANIDLPKLIVRGSYARDAHRDELLDAAQFALIDAALKYDGSGYFKAFARKKIRWAMADFWRDIDCMSKGRRKVFQQTGELRPPRKSLGYRSRIRKVRHTSTPNYALDIGALRKSLWMAGIP